MHYRPRHYDSNSQYNIAPVGVGSGLVACWFFNDWGGSTVRDALGNAHLTGSGFVWNGDGPEVNSDSGHLTCTPTFPVTNHFTYATWVRRITSFSTNYKFIGAHHTTDTVQSDYGIYFHSDNKIHVDIPWGNSDVVVSTSTVPNTDLNWHFIVVTRIGSSGSWTWKIYLDGKLDKSNTDTGNPGAGPFVYNIGNLSAANVNNGLRGRFRFAAVWNRALNGDEIQTLYRDLNVLTQLQFPFASSVTTVALTETLSDTLSFSDAISVSIIAPILLSDTLSFSDSLSSAVGIPEVLSDTLSFSDDLAILCRGVFQFSDTLSFTDTLDLICVGLLSLSDSLSFIDYLALNMIALSDSLSFSDSLQSMVTIVESFSDSITFSDSLSLRVIIPVILSDGLTFSDSLRTSAALISRELSDFILLLDSIALFKASGEGLSDQLVLNDSARVVLGINIGLSDQFTLSDQLNTARLDTQIRIGLSDQLTFSDAVAVRESTSDDNYLRRYLNDAAVVESTETADLPSADPDNADIRDYLRNYLNDTEE